MVHYKPPNYPTVKSYSFSIPKSSSAKSFKAFFLQFELLLSEFTIDITGRKISDYNTNFLYEDIHKLILLSIPNT